MAEEARYAALGGDWERAIEINQELIKRDSKDTDAHNRLGRALLEFKDLQGAYDAYSSALKSDPANLIARRNLQRLETMRQVDELPGWGEDDENERTEFPRTSVFIEEVGSTWITELASPVATPILASVHAGQPLKLIPKRKRLEVALPNGTVLGEIERNSAERIIAMIKGGNLYEVYSLGLSGSSLRIIIREVYRDPSLADRVSFPRQISGTRGYLRDRDRLRQIDEADFLMDEEEDADIESDDVDDESDDSDEDDESNESEVTEDVADEEDDS